MLKHNACAASAPDDCAQALSTVTLTGGITSFTWRTCARTIYGRIPTGQLVPAGTYGDSITVTVTF